MNEESLMGMVVVLYTAIGGFIVIDAYFNFKLSRSIHKFFGKMK
jgi:hypothetical protein